MHWICWKPGDETVGPLWLPCPAVDLLQLLALSAGPEEDSASRTSLLRLLRGNPSLLLIALGDYHRAHEGAAGSLTELVGWCQRHWLPTLFQLELRQRPASEAWRGGVIDLWKPFCQTRKPGQLRKLLRGWMKLHSDLSGSTCRQWLKPRVAKSMELEPLTGPPPGRAFREALLSRWLDAAASEIPVLSLWRLGRRLAEDVEQRTRQLRRDKLDAMRELAYGASHEINNPLANIATRAQALLTGETNPDRRRRLAVIYQQAMRAHEMISDMMLFAHPPRLDCQTVSVRLTLRRWIAEQELLWTQRPGLDFRLRIGPGVDRMRLDPTQFQVALSCLVKNSIEAIEQRETGAGHIEVRLDATEAAEGEQAGLRCTVTDDGPGMDARAGQHLFDPFFSGREAGRGLGFGLSKVWRIAQQHGGWVRHDDQFEDGTRMLLWLPAQPEDAAPNPLPLEWSWPGDQDQREAA